MLISLFFSFLQVGLFSVGGGYAAIPLIQAQIVERLGLMTMEQFTDLITIAEMTPGPISINSATFVGTRLAGVPGALLCTLGCVLPSFCICLTLAYFYYKYRGLSAVQRVLAALRPAVVALIAGAGISILLLGLFGGQPVSAGAFRPVDAVLLAGCLGLLRRYHISAVKIILGCGVVGTLIYTLLPLA